ncbi:uncharacterized protein LOC132558316 [Ylistrum balloti]|uniref:uncharacterized protein LOC132558316 n=1 Tax=Ylistrum balloti TaxID=509963 RepID=UPI002905882F|nr:uncharacterized protein LOC132558316 [Ylistrum balloti]
MKEFSVLVLVTLASSAVASCVLDSRFRGQWWIVDVTGARIQDEAITVSATDVEIVRNGETKKYSCSNTYGYRVQLAPINSEGFICLEFVPSDKGTYMYSIIRRAQSTGWTFVTQPIDLSQCSRTRKLGTVHVTRPDPGCTFPSEIQGNWSFSGDFLKDIFIEKNKLTLKTYDDNAMEFRCERYRLDGFYLFALRKENVSENKDGCLCLRFQFVKKSDPNVHVLAGQRFSAGTPIKLIDHGSPIYFHQTCDYTDVIGPYKWQIAHRSLKPFVTL